VNSIVSEEDRVQDLILRNPYNPKIFAKDKLSILDIKAQNEKSRWYNIEMQIVDQSYFAQRALYYWARLYTGQLTSGINYDGLNKTIGINVLNFDCLEEKEYHNIYKLLNTRTGTAYLEHIELHFVELGKYDENMSTLLDRWANFLKKADQYNSNKLPKELQEIDSIKRAMELLETMSLNDEEQELYEAKLKILRDEDAHVKTREAKAKAAGIAEEKVAVAQNMIQLGLEDEIISKSTGLSKNEIKRMKKKQ
jgi:predicted transposase/invertase (TIGR01784 family)